MSAHVYFYLGTPYTLFDGGLDRAFRFACRIVGDFVREGVPVFSPIVHGHSVAMHAGLDPRDHNLWIPIDLPLMLGAEALIVVRANGWQQSKGLQAEIDNFMQRGRSIFPIYPGPLNPEIVKELKRRAYFSAVTETA